MKAKQWDRDYLWRFRARTERVIDGDSFIAIADCGFGVAALPRIRIAGLNAAEMNEPDGERAFFRLGELLWASNLGDVDWPLRIVSKQRERVVAETRSFERFIADVFVVQPDGSLRDVKELL